MHPGYNEGNQWFPIEISYKSPELLPAIAQRMQDQARHQVGAHRND